VPLSLSQIQCSVGGEPTQVSAMAGQQLTAWYILSLLNQGHSKWREG
jgi:hypothetical protein